MRIKLEFSKNQEEVPMNNNSVLNSYIHNCLGRNNKYHDVKSFYSISQICGGKKIIDKAMLNFENGAFVIVSSQDQNFLDTLIKGAYKKENSGLGYGMKFLKISFITEENFHNGWNYFRTLSPILLKERIEEKRYKFITVEDENFEEKLKKHLMKVLNAYDPKLNLDGFDIKIPKHSSHRTKVVMVKNVKNIASVCHINVFANKKVAETLYNLGIGHSTGSGFGTIFKTENNNFYIF